MNAIQITHNPFTVETTFLFAGAEIPAGCSLQRFRAVRLQRWIDKLFPELFDVFNGRKAFEVTFVGIESDYRDLEEAARVARNTGATIGLSWIPSAPPEARWQDLQSLLAKVRSHPRYSTMVDTDEKLRVLLEEATDRDFDVHVVATMSSGKSTLINAMLGCDLLPSGNEATTATITRIFDNDSAEAGSFRGVRFGMEGEALDRRETMDLATMRAWNSLPDTRHIELEGNILSVTEREEVRLVLSDTPGPNNSKDHEHRRTTLSYVQDTQRCPMILYVLNATQLGINDDKDLLSLVAKTMNEGGKQNSDRFVFVLNKMDSLDLERGDDVSRILTRAREYLVEQGITDPQLFPISANLARLLRHRGGSLSKKERWFLDSAQDLFGGDDGMDLSSFSLPHAAVGKTSSRCVTALEMRSGVPALEAAIDVYIAKYHLPHRLERARRALRRIVETVVNEAELNTQLDKGESELRSMREEIAQLMERCERGVDIRVFEERIRRESVDLPTEVVEALQSRSAQITTLRREMGEAFTGRVDPREARQKIEEAQNRLQFCFDELINAYESAFAQSQELIKRDLDGQYRAYVDRVFAECDPVNFPVLERLKHRVGEFSVSLELTARDIKMRKEQTGTRRIDKSVWYKPWTWGDGYDVAIMSEIQYVDLADYYKDQLVGQMADFARLERDAVNVIERGRETLVNNFVEFIACEFKPRLDELAAQLYRLIDEGEARERALADARQMLAWGSDIRRRIDALFFVGELVEEVA